MQIGSKQWKRLLKEGGEKLSIQITEGHLDKFAAHAQELMKWTAKTNLTSITEPLEVAVKHYLDSLVPAPMIQPGASLLDIGSGGGFPGIPLKILLPSLAVTLIDASRKKVSFLMHVIRTLGLENIVARHIRAEDLAMDNRLKNAFDVIVSRALSSVADLIVMAQPLMAKTGMIITFKSNLTDAELTAIRSEIRTGTGVFGAEKNKFTLILKPYVLPYLKLERFIVIVCALNECIDRQSAGV